MAGRMSNTLSVGALKPIDGLPDPKGSLSTTIPSAAIALAILPVTAQRIDVVTSHTASHRHLFHVDGTITQCAYNLWRVYNYVLRKIIFV